MGIVSSKLAPMAIKLAWICQRLLDPMYSRIEDDDQKQQQQQQQQQQQLQLHQQQQQQQLQLQQRAIAAPENPSSMSSSSSSSSSCEAGSGQLLLCQSQNDAPATSARARRTGKSATLPANFSIVKYSEANKSSLHQQNRNRRAAQLRYRTRPSSFDAALILRGRSKSAVIVATNNPSPLRQQQQHHHHHYHRHHQRNVRIWDDETYSSSGCSSDSGSDSESDSETELRVSGNVSNDELGAAGARGNANNNPNNGSAGGLGVSAEEEEAFRLTVGRGYFTRSKKDRFLNHLRLEKRLNDLHNDYFDMACVNHRHHNKLQRHHSGDLQRIL